MNWNVGYVLKLYCLRIISLLPVRVIFVKRCVDCVLLIPFKVFDHDWLTWRGYGWILTALGNFERIVAGINRIQADGYITKSFSIRYPSWPINYVYASCINRCKVIIVIKDILKV